MGLALVLAVGLVLLPDLPPDWGLWLGKDTQRDLGASLIGGAAVGVVLVLLESSKSYRARAAAETARHTALLAELAALRKLAVIPIERAAPRLIVDPLRTAPEVELAGISGSPAVSQLVAELGSFSARELIRLFQGVRLSDLQDWVFSGLAYHASLPTVGLVTSMSSEERVAAVWSHQDANEREEQQLRAALLQLFGDWTNVGERLLQLGEPHPAEILWSARAALLLPERGGQYEQRATDGDLVAQSLVHLLSLFGDEASIGSPFREHGIEPYEWDGWEQVGLACDSDPLGLRNLLPTRARRTGEDAIAVSDLAWWEWVAFTWSIVERAYGYPPHEPGWAYLSMVVMPVVGQEVCAVTAYPEDPQTVLEASFREAITIPNRHRGYRESLPGMTRNGYEAWVGVATHEYARRTAVLNADSARSSGRVRAVMGDRPYAAMEPWQAFDEWLNRFRQRSEQTSD